MPDPSYEEQAKAVLADLSEYAESDYERRANMIAHAQVLATLEMGERLWKVELALGLIAERSYRP